MEGEIGQKKLTRIRPPVVQATYELEAGSAMELEQLPFDLPDLPGGAELSESERLPQRIKLFRQQMQSRSAPDPLRSSQDGTGIADPEKQEGLRIDQQAQSAESSRGEEGETE